MTTTFKSFEDMMCDLLYTHGEEEVLEALAEEYEFDASENGVRFDADKQAKIILLLRRIENAVKLPEEKEANK